jgi:hypothetical protein
LQLAFALLEEALLLLPTLAILRGALLLQTQLPALPVGIIALSRSAPLARLSLLALALLLFQPAPLLIGLASLIVPTPVALPLGLLLLLPNALLFRPLLLLNLTLLGFSQSSLLLLLAALLELGTALFLTLLLPDALLLSPLLLVGLALLRGRFAPLLFLLAPLLPQRVALLLLLLPDALLFRPLLLLRLSLLRFSLSLLLLLLLPLLAFSAPLFLLLVLRLCGLRVVLPALFLGLATTPAPLCIGLCAGADDGYRRDGQDSREPLDKFEFHEASYTWI